MTAIGQLHLSFVRSQQGRAPEALILLELSREVFVRHEMRWEEAATWVLTAWAQIALGRLAEAGTACALGLRLIEPIGDSWGRIHAEAMLCGLAQAEQRFADAAVHLSAAANAAHRLGLRAAEAHHLTSLGRVHDQLGQPQQAIDTLQRAIDVGRSTGDLRTVAMARVRLGRVLRAVGQPAEARTELELAHRWYARAGGGDGAALAECLLAVIDLTEGVRGAEPRLDGVIDRARAASDLEVEVLGLDGLAAGSALQGRDAQARQALDRADGLLRHARHLIGDGDRIDRDRAVESYWPDRTTG